MTQVAILLFKDFETLDAFGPAEIFGILQDQYQVKFYSLAGGIIKNHHGVHIQTDPMEEIEHGVDIFLIPGGYGTRTEVDNGPFIESTRMIASRSRFVLTVCTGSALLARTGLLDGRTATSNKRAFDWVVTQGNAVQWIRKARWTRDEQYYTSAGVSAGMDMTLGFLRDQHGEEFARLAARRIEYHWADNADEDLFCEA